MRSFLLVVLLLTTTLTFAQPPTGTDGPPKIGTVKGIVVDDVTNEPLPYVVVQLYNTRFNKMVGGGITDVKGYFEIGSLPPGTIILKTSFIEYEDFTTDTFLITPANPTKFFERIGIKPKTNQIGTVKVEGERSLVESGIDKKVYNVEKDLANVGGSAVDVLQNVPSVTVNDDRSINLRGASVNILIDGKPSNLAATGSLDQIPANLIEKIEVITNPGARYDADGVGGIINVILKKNEKPGLNGTATLNVGTNPTYNPGINLSLRTKKINISTAYNYNYSRFFQRNNFDTRNFVDTTFFITQRSNGINTNIGQTARIATEWYINNFNTLSASVTGAFNQGLNTQIITYGVNNANQNPLFTTQRNTFSPNQGNSYDALLNYKRTFRGENKSLSADVSLSSNIGTDSLNAAENTIQGITQPWQRQITGTMRDNLIITGQIDFTWPIKASRLETGVKTIQRSLDNDFVSFSANPNSAELTKDINLSNRFVYTDQVYAAYLSLTGPIGKKNTLGYVAGLRAEHTLYEVDQRTLNQKFDSAYFSLFPSAFLKYKPKDVLEFSLGYTRRINRPGVQSLNPFAEFTDPRNIFIGDPFLKPELINSFELSGQFLSKKVTLTTTLFYRYTTDPFTRFRRPNADGVIVTTFSNLKQSNNVGLDLNLRYDPLKWWRINLGGSVFYSNIDASNLQASLSNDGFAGNGRLLNVFKPFKDFEIQLAYNINVWNVISQGRIIPIQALDASAKYDLLKGKLSLVARLSDVFDTRQFEVNTAGLGFEQNVLRKRQTRIGFIGITYRFGKQPTDKKATRTTREGGSMEDSGGGGGF